ncbi:MAG: tetratricopeptide repeat protein [Promethearchaeota archaeon]|nr:MAG: tetratricopeptide repeat protein [Candidatus Lokiarchaeota archaeon]
MTHTKLTFKDLIEDEDLTFLVGAGCSIDIPSCLPAGKAMMEAILKYICAESELKNVLNIKELRFEQLIEIIRDQLDPNLKIIDYYGLCDKPNLQHFFLAEMIKKGHFVMTTNFDFLIEYALKQSGIPKKDIISIITKRDFENYDNPADLFNQGKKIVYKIHGSTKNIITGEDTKDSLITTIQAFGSGKEGVSVFQVEPFKRPLFENISFNRTIVVIGYSGSDDFDVVPTLKVLKQIKNIIWIDFVSEDNGREEIFEIVEENNKKIENFEKSSQILLEISRMKNAKHIFKVKANTSRLLKELLEPTIVVEEEQFSIDLLSWLQNNIRKPDEFRKFSIPYKIYIDFSMYQDALRCSKALLSIANEKNSLKWQSIGLNNIGEIFKTFGEYPEALKYYQEALKIDNQLGNLLGKGIILNNIAGIYSSQGKYTEALKLYEESLKIDEHIKNISGRATCLNNMGLIYKLIGDYSEALSCYQEALKIDEQEGNLSGKAARLNNIGELFYRQGKNNEALNKYQEALKIDDQLGNLSGKADDLNNIGELYKVQGNYKEALKYYGESLQIHTQLGEPTGIAIDLTNIGDLYALQEEYDKGLEKFHEALKIDEKIGDLAGKAIDLNNIGGIYRLKGNYSEALKNFQEALKINEQIGDPIEKATYLNNIGEIYRLQGDFSNALKLYEKALAIDEEIGNLAGKAVRNNNIGEIYNIQKKYPEALEKYKGALKIDEELGDLNNIAIDLTNIGFLYDDQKKNDEALLNLEKALQILIKLGIDNTSRAKNIKNKIEILKNK